MNEPKTLPGQQPAATEPIDYHVPTAPVAVPVKRRSSGNRWLDALVALAVLVFIGGVAFAAGRLTAPAQAAGLGAGQGLGFANGQNGGQLPSGSFDPSAFPGGGFGGFGSRTVSGTVSSIDGSVMTLTTAEGQTITVDASGTTYHSQTAASASDVSQGSSVQVMVEGGQGFPGGPAASPGLGSGNQTLTATDVTIVGQ